MKSDGATKKKILGCIFAEELALEKGKVINPVFTEPVKLVFRISVVLDRLEEKKEVDIDHSLVATIIKNNISRK